MENENKGIISTYKSFYSFQFEPRSSSINFEELPYHKGYNFTEIISSKELKCYFLFNNIDNLIYRIKFEDLGKLENLHFMISEKLRFGKLMKITKNGRYLGFIGTRNKIIILHNLGGEDIKEYSTVFLRSEEEIADFKFYKNKRLLVLTTTGTFYKFIVKKRVSELEEKSEIINPYFEFGEGDFYTGFKICHFSKIIVLKNRNLKRENSEKMNVFEYKSFKHLYEMKLEVENNVKELLIDYYIGDYPVAFVFPENEPKMMFIYILYEDKAKKICSIQTLHFGNLIAVTVNKTNIISLCDNGVINVLQIL